MQSHTSSRQFLLSGALAGAASAFAFTALHHLLISDIWFSLLPMLTAGALCGLCIAWSYGRLFSPPLTATWLLYNLTYVALFLLLGVASVLVFEPIASIPALLAANEPPRELIEKAMPLTIGFILASATLMGVLRGRNLVDFAAILLTCTVLMVLLGLNVSVLGLVHVPRGVTSLIVEMFALILVLNVAYLVIFLFLERRRLLHHPEQE